MEKYIIDSPKGDKCVLWDNMPKILNEKQMEEFNLFILNHECIGIEVVGKIDVAIPVELINKFLDVRK